MKMTKKQLVETLVQEIMKELESRVREIIREEMRIEKKLLRKDLLEEFKQPSELIATPTHRSVAVHHRPTSTAPSSKKKIDTGDQTLNAILEDVEADMEVSMLPELTGHRPTATVADVSQQMLNEHKKNGQSEELWKPPEGEGFNFDPTRMDPTRIDWTAIIDAKPEKKL